MRRVEAAAARRAAAAATAAQPVLELNEQAADATDDVEPIGRRIDDILTTKDTFDVAGFGQVRWTVHSLTRACMHTWAAKGWGLRPPRHPLP